MESESSLKLNVFMNECSMGFPSRVAGLNRHRMLSLFAASSRRLYPDDFSIFILETLPSILTKIFKVTAPASSIRLEMEGKLGFSQ